MEVKDKRHRSVSVVIMEVVVVTTTTGKGTLQDPNRIIVEFWSKDGQLLAVEDTAK